MSNKLETLKQAFIAQKSLTSLMEYLEMAQKEMAWSEIVDALENWDGTSTPELDFYLGNALTETGRKSEGIKKLQAIIAINPNHFKAKKKLDELGSEQDGEKTAEIQKLKLIPLPQMKLEDTDGYKAARRRSITIIFSAAAILIIAVAAIIASFSGGSGIEKQLEEPQRYLYPMSFGDFEKRSEELKLLDNKLQKNDDAKIAIFYLTAFAAIDYNLFKQKEIVSQARFYYTLISKKEPIMGALYDYFENKTLDHPATRKNYLEANFPATLDEIKKADLSCPELNSGTLRNCYLSALLLYRTGEFERSSEIIKKILLGFPGYELAQKLDIAVRTGIAVKGKISIDKAEVERLKGLLVKWKKDSEERYLLGEDFLSLGKAAGSFDLEKEGFYLSCPGRYFCGTLIRDYIKRGFVSEAKKMALYIKEQKGGTRNDEDLRLVMITSKEDGDYGNCYFAFKELQQFFPDKFDNEALRAASICSEKEHYLEEAISYYEELNASENTPAMSAKIYELRYLLKNDPAMLAELKKLVDAAPDSLPLLYSYLKAVETKGDLKEIVPVLNSIYELEKENAKVAVVTRYFDNGAIMPAMEILAKNSGAPGFSLKLLDMYSLYLLFDEADSILKKGTVKEADAAKWKPLRDISKLISDESYESAITAIEKIEANQEKCSPPLLLLKAESYRRMGNTQRTFSMIDGMLECSKFYLPGLMFAAEISFYQGDVKRAEKGIAYILDNENYFSPVKNLYHNYLILLSGEILLNRGKERELITFLGKNLITSVPLSKKDQEKLQDLYDKLKRENKNQLEKYINRVFRTKR